MKNKGITLVSLVVTIIALIVFAGVAIGIIQANINTSSQTTIKKQQEECNHDWVVTSTYDFMHSTYKTISKCSKCGKEV